MPNICFASMIVKGRKDSVDEFIRVIQADYNYKKMEFSHIPHFFRIFDTYIDYYEQTGIFVSAGISINCAWSVKVCMFDGPFSYYDSRRKELNNYATHILELSKQLSLEIEIFSEEEGISFQEHYHIVNGILTHDDCWDIYTYYIDEYDTLEDYKADNDDDIDLTPEQYKTLKINGMIYYTKGGKPWDFSVQDDPKYLGLINMVKTVDK